MTRITHHISHPSIHPLALALVLDHLLGEPPNALHPVVWLGRLIGALERHAPHSNPRHEFLYGVGIAALSISAAALPALLIERVLRLQTRGSAGIVAYAWLLKTSFAWRTLLESGARVRHALEQGDQDQARVALRWLVSRDTSELDSPLIAAAVIESLAENASDSVVAPLCCYALFGLPGAWAYRAANTLDAMIGYRGRYEYLGKAAARLDDALNWLPARLTALLIIAAAPYGGGESHHAWATWRHDHRRTASPNAGHPMSAIAGALNVCLEKKQHYQLHSTGTMPRDPDIQRAERVINLALTLAAVLALLAEGRRQAGVGQGSEDSGRFRAVSQRHAHSFSRPSR